VHEAKGEQSARLIDHLKKGDMAREAERLLDGTGWLPEPLRLVEAATAGQDADGEAEALPEFLATGEDEAICCQPKPCRDNRQPDPVAVCRGVDAAVRMSTGKPFPRFMASERSTRRTSDLVLPKAAETMAGG
jgi:hypothetical protein